MSDEPVAIERHAPDALSQIVGTGNTKAMLAQVEENVRAVIEVARARGFVRRYGDNQSEFYGEPAWSLLGLTYNLVAFVEWTREVPNGWEARAVARTREGTEMTAAEAMCTRSEPGKQKATDHTLRAMAQTRARRNALRSALGAALILAGFDFPDPEAPATKQQVGLLHQLERDLGYTHAQGHEIANVESYKELTREQAGELIETWQTEIDKRGGTPVSAGGAAPSSEDTGREKTPAGQDGTDGAAQPPGQAVGPDTPGTPHPPGPVSDPTAPASAEQWARALRLFSSDREVLRAHAVKFGKSVKASEITAGEIGELIEAKSKGEIGDG